MFCPGGPGPVYVKVLGSFTSLRSGHRVD
jgi:hypothetical protein